eukprot:scaffold4288_cov325-Ochromonas_danica.AAC.1
MLLKSLGVRKPKRCFEELPGWRKLSRGARSLIKGMLKRNPVKRLDIEECLSHPWLKLAEEGKMVLGDEKEVALMCRTMSCDSEKSEEEEMKKKVVVPEEESRRMKMMMVRKPTIYDEALPDEVQASYVKRSEHMVRRNAKREAMVMVDDLGSE